jgi:PAS domain S-box-containing protein
VTALSTPTRYIVAAAAAAFATFARMALDPAWGERHPYITFFPAIMLSGWLGGLGPGLLTTLISALTAIYFWMAPIRSFRISDSGELLGLAVFVLVGIVISVLNEAWRRGTMALGDSERQLAELAAIVSGSDDAIVSKDLQSTIRSWNTGAERIFGYTAEEMIGRSIRVIIPQDRWSEEDEVLLKIGRGEKVDHFETVRRRKDGTDVPVSLTISPVYSGGVIVGASKIARDISERKQAEADRAQILLRERQARAELERAGRLKDDFLAILSHELRTPVNAVLGYAQLLLKGVVPPKEVPQAVQAIERNAQAQSRLVESLLDMSRVMAGKLELNLKGETLSTIVEAAVDAVRPEALRKNIVLEVADTSNFATVSGDAVRLQQVFWNLLSNSLKFTAAGGRVTAVVTTDGPSAIVQIIDNGRGIPADLLPHVFDRFRQGVGEAAREQAGLGLGLSLVRELVQAHRGKVTGQSDGEGRGATFTVTLPLAPADAADSRNVPGTIAATGSAPEKFTSISSGPES